MLIVHTVHIFFKATMHVKDRLIECNNYFGRNYMWIFNPFPVGPPPPPPPPPSNLKIIRQRQSFQ
jgi:hypothetical protein